MIPRFLATLLVVAAVSSAPPADSSREFSRRDENADFKAKLEELQTLVDTHFGADAKAAKNTLAVIKAQVDKGGDRVKNLNTVVDGIITNIPKLKSEKPADVAMAVTSIISTVAGVVPGPYGAIISGLASLATSLIGVANKAPKMIDLINDVVEKNIKASERRTLFLEIAGVKDEFVYVKNFLNEYMSGEVKPQDITNVGQQFQILTGVQLLGKLKEQVTTQGSQSKSQQELEDTIKLVKGFCTLSAMRYSLLNSMYFIYSQSDLTSATERGVQAAMKTMKELDTDFLKFLAAPSREMAKIAAAYRPSKHPEVASYLKWLEVPFEEMRNEVAGKCYTIHSLKWTDRSYQLVGNQHLELLPGTAAKFQFRKSGDFWFWSMKNNNHMGFSANDGWVTWRYQQGDRTNFKLVRTSETKNGDGVFYIVGEKYQPAPVVAGSKWWARATGDPDQGDESFYRFKAVDC